MPISTFTEFNLPRNAYAAFDAVSMKQLITNRLKSSGLFPDVDFEGSNISGLIDIIAYMYHVNLFYLNQTASEAMFSQVEIYENINKMVSLVGYKPQGYQTSLLGFDFTAGASLTTGFYTLKRFSYIQLNGIPYTFNRDITFEKTTTDAQLIESVGSTYTLQQGLIKEYPAYTAIGEAFEQFTITIAAPTQTSTPTYVDHNNIYVFVLDVNTQTWSEWTESTTLYGAGPSDKFFEKRFNENGRYELKFGDNITGKQLNTGDVVAVYYLQSDGPRGAVSNNALNGKTIVLFNTSRWNNIFNDIQNPDLNYMSVDQVRYITLGNQFASTLFTSPETTADIKNNTPLLFSAQNRTVTVEDFTSVLMKNFSNILADVSVVNNSDYTESYLKYFYDIGLERPNDDLQVLMNQVTFTDACDFNNVYIFAVPKYGAIQNEITPTSLPVSQKQLIVDRLNTTKLVNQNIVVSDPVYQAFSFGLSLAGEDPAVFIKDETTLRVYRSTEYNTPKELIKSKVANLIQSFFSINTNKLGGIVNLTQLNIDILSIPGISKIETVRSGTGDRVVPKINMIIWNPFYEDATPNVTSQNISLKYFEFPFLYQASNLINKIEVV
jgi:hypothetical protein